ncbi:hypothetical protein ACFVR1_14270 [Psychrobacillus sp. NPDC058041]|uniref:hypothetical protein n=1 Tax=Psychrobacillus sp. NPDC058041 TaxID=3346310 RepID=UPI0036DABD26
MRKNWSPYVWKLLWVVGLIALVLISYHLENKVRNHVAITFQPLSIFWFMPTAYFVFGIYISLVLVRDWTFKWNWPLVVCVTIPLLIIAFYSPVIYTIVQSISSDNNFSLPIPFWMMKINSLGIPSIVAGITLMVGMMGKKKEDYKEIVEG